ncbi:hypothetical protein [Ekhidna sp.]|jgi:phosphomannomutase|uniref:hypothetical protein n=1 Tax=Ekhidna sp. TaxID=2608089 RepID=UPI0032ED3DE0
MKKLINTLLVGVIMLTACHQKATIVGYNVVMDKRGKMHRQTLDSTARMYEKVRFHPEPENATDRRPMMWQLNDYLLTAKACNHGK